MIVPKIDLPPPPRLVPIRCLPPGSAFRCPPGGTVAGGRLVEMLGDDAKVLLDDARSPTYWSSESPVYRDGEQPTAIPQPKRPIPTGPSRVERREAKAKVERVMARVASAPAATPTFFGSEG